MVERSAPHLKRATVNEQGNNQAVSSARTSRAANLVANMRQPDDPVTKVLRRTFEFANAHAPFGFDVEGQEPLSVIQYEQGQEYRPHCDGACDGLEHLHAGRVATMLMYCVVPEQGGGTTFSRADVYIKPRQGQAVFFSYRGPDGRMDSGLTEHSGCPVLNGTKWVVTQWFRDGVSELDHWTKYDPAGGRL